MANELVQEEKPIHRKAFEIYYALGEDRSIRNVAKEMNKSSTTIHNWSKSFNWRERVEIRDTTVHKQLEKKTLDTIVDLKAQYHKIIKATIFQAVEDIKNGTLKIESMSDLQKMVQLDLELLGEEDRRSKGMMEELNSAITQSMAFFSNMEYEDYTESDNDGEAGEDDGTIDERDS